HDANLESVALPRAYGMCVVLVGCTHGRSRRAALLGSAQHHPEPTWNVGVALLIKHEALRLRHVNWIALTIECQSAPHCYIHLAALHFGPHHQPAHDSSRTTSGT